MEICNTKWHHASTQTSLEFCWWFGFKEVLSSLHGIKQIGMCLINTVLLLWERSQLTSILYVYLSIITWLHKVNFTRSGSFSV